MIITRLRGGLGNQMFQYAAARRLAVYHKTQLKLDVSYYATQTKRKYGLDGFNIKACIATPLEVEKLKKKAVGKPIRLPAGLPTRLVSSLLPEWLFQKTVIFTEPYIQPYNITFLNTPRHVYLDGYWQSEKYFLPAADRIRAEFKVIHPLTGENLVIANQIQSCTSVSLHFRGGDYINDIQTQQTHGYCTTDYYQRSITYIKARIPNPVFFIFSDDPDWVNAHLKLEDMDKLPTQTFYVCHNLDGNEVDDLHLMSLCQHHIIANSTFSWWGAWLNPFPDKIVLAPATWFRDPQYDTSDVLPSEWIKI